MGWQEIVITVIGISVVAIVIKRILCTLRHKERNPCCGCGKTCPLKSVKKKN